MRGTDAPDAPSGYRIEVPTRHGTDSQQPMVITGQHLSSGGLIAWHFRQAAHQCTWGKPRIGKPKRNKARAKMARQSRRRNRG